jgi:glycine/D-amino acid oxidase-like deaminating enzyme
MKTGISIWEDETFFAPQDFVVIGAGLVGLWCALELKLKSPNATITVLEKGVIPTGASTRNAGFACFGSPTEMIADACTMGQDKMWATVAMRYEGIQKIRKHFGDAIINYDACGGYECMLAEKAEEVNDNLPWLNAGLKTITGRSESFRWSDEKLSTFGLSGFDHLIENQMEGGLHSGKLVKALMQKVQRAGVSILTGIEVESIIDQAENVTIRTKGNVHFTAAKVVICTNAYTGMLEKNMNVTPARGQVMVTEPLEHLKLKGTFHYDEGFYYFRNVGNRVLIGGARNKAFDEEQTTELAVTIRVQDELKRFLSSHILQDVPYTISHCWSGIMGFTDNKEPMIKEVRKNVLAVIACNGMGVALSPIIAESVMKFF